MQTHLQSNHIINETPPFSRLTVAERILRLVDFEAYITILAQRPGAFGSPGVV